MKYPEKNFFLLILLLALAVNFAGINTRFITDDPGLYASISKNFIYKHTFFNLFTYNKDWLDKPHFPFWCVLLSFRVFGVSVWAYRLPGLFFFLLALLYTWLFTRKFYNDKTAALAVLILATALNTMMGNTDLRAEPYLMALVMGSIYHISVLNERFSPEHLLMAALCTACAVMTKGIFVIVAIYGALLGQLAFQKQLKSLFKLKWLLLVLLTLIFILPELYALYTQFDQHPEKTVFGRDNVSGIRWFLWDSQFGRFANSGPITRKSGSIFFFLHTLLWAFAPWCLLFYYAVFKKIKTVWKGSPIPEYFTLSGGLLLLALFSVSRFQLPFYTNALFPLFAVITAPFCDAQLSRFGTKYRQVAQWLFIILLPVAVVVLNMLLKPTDNFYLITGLLFFGVISALMFIKIAARATRLFYLSCLAALLAGFYLNTVFYNEVAPYKGQVAAAAYVNANGYYNSRIYVLNAENNLFQFYVKKPVEQISIQQFIDYQPNGDLVYFYVNQQTLDDLVRVHARFKIIRAFVDYPKENVTPDFINKNTRIKTLGKVYLVTKTQ